MLGLRGRFSLRRFASKFITAASRVAEWPAYKMRLTRPNFFVRWIAMILWLGIPLAVACLNLPDLEKLRENVERKLPLLNSSWLLTPLAGFFCSWLVVAIGLLVYAAWSVNERRRQRNSRNASAVTQVNLPDLRFIAAGAAIALIIAIPLVLFYSNELSCTANRFGCWFAGSKTTIRPWAFVDVDQLFQLFPFWVFHDLFSWHNFSSITPISKAAAQLIVFIRAVWQLIVLATLFALLTISNSISAAVVAVGEGNYVPITSIGSRALCRLYKAIDQSEKQHDDGDDDDSGVGPLVFVKRAANAIGEIGDPSSLTKLRSIAQKPRDQTNPGRFAVKAMTGLLAKLASLQLNSPDKGLLARLKAWRFRRTVRYYHAWAKQLLISEETKSEQNPRRANVSLKKNLIALIHETGSLLQAAN